MNISWILAETARLFPEREAVVFEGMTFRYRELHAQVGRLAAALHSLGIAPGDRVALWLPNIPAFITAYYAIQQLGGVVVSVSTRSTAAEAGFVLDDCGARLLFTTAQFRDVLSRSDLPNLLQVVIVEGEAGRDLPLSGLLQHPASDCPAIERERHDPSAILYTSGTTGQPKGATLSQGNLMSNAWSVMSNCGLTPQDRVLLAVPLFHCFGQNVLMNSSLLAGATLVLRRTNRPDHVLQALEEQHVTMLFGVPTMFISLLERATPASLQSLRYCFSAAATLPDEVEQQWLDRFGLPIHQGYGLTETAPLASYNHRRSYRHGSVGQAIENVELKIVDLETGHDLPAGELGEILIRGPNVMLGYWNRPDDTARAIRNGWFHSGDIGRRDADGYLFITDRLKDMINVGGMNVYPAEVENVLFAHPAVAEAAVFGVADRLLGEQVCARVVLKSGQAADQEALQAFCRSRLADFKVPRHVVFAQELPRNAAGKLLKRVMRDEVLGRTPAVPQAPAARAYQAASGPTRLPLLTDLLRNEVGQLLDLEPTQVDCAEPLTDLGLESLAAVDLAIRLRSLLGVDLPALQLVDGNSINSLTGLYAALLDATPPHHPLA